MQLRRTRRNINIVEFFSSRIVDNARVCVKEIITYSYISLMELRIWNVFIQATSHYHNAVMHNIVMYNVRHSHTQL